MKKVSPVLLVILIFLNSCASIFSGRFQTVKIKADDETTILVDGNLQKEKGTQKVVVKRGSKTHEYRFEKEGYEPSTVVTRRKLNGVVFLNLLILTFPAILDFANGSAFKHNTSVETKLEPTGNSRETASTAIKASHYSFEKASDVDKNVPETGLRKPNRFALIIGNEDYSSFQSGLDSESNVAYARNDASAFKEYATKTMGIPERNIIFILDGTYGAMKQGLEKLALLAKSSQGEAEIFFYYAGHGLPEEGTNVPYLMPVDISGKRPQDGLALNSALDKLTAYPCKSVTVFMDACFSGGARGQGLVEARGFKVKPKEGVLRKNIVTFSASSGSQSSFAYEDQKHGLFTYFLLRELKITNGNISYGELAESLQRLIPVESLLVNDKEQNPQVNISPDLGPEWKKWRLAK